MFRTRMTLDSMFRRTTILFGTMGLLFAVATLVTRAGPGFAACFGICFVFAFAWAMSPRAIEIGGGELRVKRRAWAPVRVPLRFVGSAEAHDGTGGRAIRVFGVGGLFGSFGLFSNPSLGRFHLYATRRGPTVVVRRNDDALPLVLTPDDVQGTVEAIERSRRESQFGSAR